MNPKFCPQRFVRRRDLAHVLSRDDLDFGIANANASERNHEARKRQGCPIPVLDGRVDAWLHRRARRRRSPSSRVCKRLIDDVRARQRDPNGANLLALSPPSVGFERLTPLFQLLLEPTRVLRSVLPLVLKRPLTLAEENERADGGSTPHDHRAPLRRRTKVPPRPAAVCNERARDGACGRANEADDGDQPVSPPVRPAHGPGVSPHGGGGWWMSVGCFPVSWYAGHHCARPRSFESPGCAAPM